MKQVYPVIFEQTRDGWISCTVPDFLPYNTAMTQGENMADAIIMSRDLIGIMGNHLEDIGTPLPIPSKISKIQQQNPKAVVSLVDVDFYAHRKQSENFSVRRNVSLPAWLDSKAHEANVNVSAILQEALKRELGVNKAG
jgi:Uncharacterized conserved protein